MFSSLKNDLYRFIKFKLGYVLILIFVALQVFVCVNNLPIGGANKFSVEYEDAIYCCSDMIPILSAVLTVLLILLFDLHIFITVLFDFSIIGKILLVIYSIVSILVEPLIEILASLLLGFILGYVLSKLEDLFPSNNTSINSC